jgi:predicted TIM-barrel fold metal-dependent hydrolase
MTTVANRPSSTAEDVTTPVPIVSSDTHVGPRMKEDLRPYCPRQYLEQFDGFVADVTPVRDWWYNSGAPNGRAPGHYDSAARKRDLDRDGVAAEVLFHFSFNGELVPFAPTFLSSEAPTDLGLAAVGMHIYNSWLADFCADAPGRRVGLVQLPLWDIELAVKEVEWAAANGLRGANFPGQRDILPPYDDPVYEPLWAACSDLNMPLTTHAGAASPSSMVNEAVVMMETGGVLCRRAVHRLMFCGAFDRYPGLKLVMTEQPGLWQLPLMEEMDSIHNAIVKNPSRGAVVSKANAGQHAAAVPGMTESKWRGVAINTKRLEPLAMKPSEYFMKHCFVGASFMAHFEAVGAIEQGISPTMMWGSDYPHPEGTWKEPESDDEASQTLLSLQATFQGLAGEHVRAMAGENAVRCYGLDLDHLKKVAEDISAPTVADLTRSPEDELRGRGGTGRFAFRHEAYWY